MIMLKFTPIQQKIINLLSDGRPHTKEELYVAMGMEGLTIEEDLSNRQDHLKAVNLANHVSKIRKILQPYGQDIVCVSTGWSSRYQHVRMLTQCGDGRR